MLIQNSDFKPEAEHMEAAIAVAKQNQLEGGHAVAAVIVLNDEIIAEAGSTVNQEQDSTCHAEINAIRQACKHLVSKKLSDCVIYCTYEPCPMCATAIAWSKMSTVVYGASMDVATNNAPQRIRIKAREVLGRSEYEHVLVEEFMAAECEELLKL